MSELISMRSAFDERAILKRVAALDPGGAQPEIEGRVYYPYFRFVVRGALRWLFGRRVVRVDCLIDARTGRAATADDVSVETVSSDAASRLPVRQDPGAGRRQAERYTRHALGRAFRILAGFRLQADEGELVHRPYWVVRASGTRLLVDGVTGELHPMPRK